MAIRSRNKTSAEFSSASISDIVFLLLIYFMLTASFVKQSSLKVELPQGESVKPSEGKNYVTITADQTYAWNNQLLDTRDDLVPFIEEVLQDDDLENDVISLRLDRDAVVDDAVFVMDVVAKNDGKVFILTKKR
ncbi:MAG: biopolymer transporter ExbD [Bacteroidota bacterium]